MRCSRVRKAGNDIRAIGGGQAEAHNGGKAKIVDPSDLLDVRFDSAVEDGTMQLMDDLQVVR